MAPADLIPESFLTGPNWYLWALALGGIAVLVFGADRAVTGAARLARALGVPMIVVGATVVSLGTTSPEAFVSVTAAFRGQPALALGNGVGSIICDTALIFGLCCLIARLPKDRFVLARHGWLQLAAGVLLAGTLAGLAVAAGGIEGVVIPRWVGVVYVVLLAGYLWMSVRWSRRSGAVAGSLHPPPPAPRRPRRAAANLLMVAVGLALVVGGSNVLIGSVGELCRRYRVPPDVLAVTLVAFGTSLPELATAIASIVRGHAELLVGNIIGADILNVLFVIGASATASPLAVPPLFFRFHLPVMLAALVLLRVFIFWPGATFRRWQGAALLALFGGYYVALLVCFAVA